MDLQKSNTIWEIMKINDAKMLLSNGRWYKFLSGKPETWKVGDKVDIKTKSAPRDGAIGKTFATSLIATNLKGGEPQSISFIKDDQPADQSSPEKRFNTLADVVLDNKEYIIEEIDSNSNITVGSKKFTLNTMLAKGKVEDIDWAKGDFIVFSKGAVKLANKLTVKNVGSQKGKYSGKYPELSYYFT